MEEGSPTSSSLLLCRDELGRGDVSGEEELRRRVLTGSLEFDSVEKQKLSFS